MNIAMGQKALYLPVDDYAFPATLQYSPVASLDSLKEEQSSTTIEKKHKAIEDIIGHGFSSLWIRSNSGDGVKKLLNHAQLRGMKLIT
jgi:hypothetical protein